MRLFASLRSLPRRACGALTFAALALPAGAAPWLDGPMSTFDTAGPVAKEQLRVFYYTLWVTLFLFVVVGAVLAYATLKFRAKTEADEHAEPPPQSHGNPLVEVGLTVGSIVCLVIIAVPTLHAIWFTDDVPAGSKDPYEITATGYQWWFKFEYPKEPIAGAGVLITANELVIPVGRPVHINLRTTDVIHSFWVPKLAGKVDMIPNRANRLWLEADKAGYYYGQCAEYCGESHAIMRFRVIALDQADFDKWLANQKQPARDVAGAPATPATPASSSTSVVLAKLDLTGRTKGEALSGMDKLTNTQAYGFADWQAKQLASPTPQDTVLIAQGSRLFKEKNCLVCHTIRGFPGATGINAPDLTHVGSRSTIAAGVLENTPQRMSDWLTDPDHWKPGNKMFHGITSGEKVTMPGYLKPNADGFVIPTANGEVPRNIALSAADITALTAYLQSLK